MRRRNRRSGFVDQLLKSPVPKIAEDHARRIHRVGRKLRRDLRKKAAGHKEKIRQPVIIEIDDTCPPTNKPCFDRQTGSESNVVEESLTVVSVQNVGVV